MTREDIKPPVNLRIASMTDLARMLVSWSQRDRPASMLYFEHEGKHIYGTLISNHGYFEYYGMPLWVHAMGEGPPEGSFLAYRARPRETLDWVESLEGAEPQTVHMPVIKLAKKLEILDI